jgi:DNA-nicking Smr family endonuclease
MFCQLIKKMCSSLKIKMAYCPYSDQPDMTDEALVALENLVAYGKGFDVESTSEYIEGTGPDICREVVKRLHQGIFSIQGFIDLHGLTVAEAREVFENFLKESIASGKRGNSCCSWSWPFLTQ